MTWGIFDTHEDPADRERAVFLGGFPTKAAAQAAIPQLVRDLYALGIEVCVEEDLCIRKERPRAR